MAKEIRNLVGIDLGTTMSVIACVDQSGAVVTLPNSDGDPLTPSAIYIDGPNVVVGRAAKQAESHLPDKVATFVKRDIGKQVYSRTVDGRQFRPETLSAMILRKLKQDAERRIGPIENAVITVPAFFDDARRKATEDAGRIAGLNVLGIINEPTSAALAYCLEGQFNRQGSPAPALLNGSMTALVYDLGGGTFDVTSVRLQKNRVDTLATDGAVKLGGKDWDDRIVRHVVDEFAKRHNVQIPTDRRQAIANHAEATKKLLSQLPTAEVECYFQDRSLRTMITRAQFEELTRDLLASTEVVTNLVVKQSKLPGSDTPLTWKDIDRVLLVGGSTKMPMVPAMLKRVTGKDPDRSLDPDQVVARGAAIYATVLAVHGREGELVMRGELPKGLRDIDIVDVNSHSLGIEVYNPATDRTTNAIIIPKNTRLPCAVSRRFPLRAAGITTVRVKVLEGEAPDPEANIQLGECVVSGLPAALPQKSPVQVRLSYSTSGRVGVMALDMTGGRFAQAEIERRAGLSDAEVRDEAKFLNTLTIQ